MNKLRISDEGNNGVYLYPENATAAIAKFYDNNPVVKTKEDAIKYADNIVKAVNSHDEIIEALIEAKVQIQYLHEKFKETGTGNKVIAKIENALKSAKS